MKALGKAKVKRIILIILTGSQSFAIIVGLFCLEPAFMLLQNFCCACPHEYIDAIGRRNSWVAHLYDLFAMQQNLKVVGGVSSSLSKVYFKAVTTCGEYFLSELAVFTRFVGEL